MKETFLDHTRIRDNFAQGSGEIAGQGHVPLDKKLTSLSFC